MNADLLIYFAAIAVIVAIGLGMLWLMGRGAGRKGLDAAWYQEHWRAIEEQFNDGESGRLLAIVNADKLLDKAMRERGFKGETMGERLKNRPQAFKDINSIWSAHKLRNRIAHENGVKISEKDARRALDQLKTGLKNLGAV